MTPAEQDQIYISGVNCYLNIINLVVDTSIFVQNILGYLATFHQVEVDIVKSETQALPLSLAITEVIQICLTQIIIVTGDLVICWRAWVLLPHDKFWRFVLSIVTICNIGINIAAPIFDELGVTSSPAVLLVVDWASTAISLVVNMTATSLIGWKAW
ncbi:hypothetical protein BDP27DRAFT_1374888 [Rhodocollybia butyracea]|uniref:Uncharacterized protein n=1 Tax=Rhodocollybia butyracea TaxID=206335 RepID=A0A9P5P736_9AGAR|nr:hypothetical protein BDP27DRAFT_1374888 [Rhodocollybia butyracea]